MVNSSVKKDDAVYSDSTLNTVKLAESAMALHLASMGLSVHSFSEKQQKALEKTTSLPLFKMLTYDSSSCKRVEAVAKLTLSNMKEFRKRMKMENELHVLRCKSNEVNKANNFLEGAIEMHSEYLSASKHPLDEELAGDCAPKENPKLPSAEELANTTLFRILELVDRVNKAKEQLAKPRRLYDSLKFTPGDINDLQELLVEKRKRLQCLKRL